MLTFDPSCFIGSLLFPIITLYKLVGVIYPPKWHSAHLHVCNNAFAPVRMALKENNIIWPQHHPIDVKPRLKPYEQLLPSCSNPLNCMFTAPPRHRHSWASPPHAFHTPTRITRSAYAAGFGVESPNNDGEFQQDIVWDASSPSPVRAGKHTFNWFIFIELIKHNKTFSILT